MKKDRTLPVAVEDDDINALDEIRNRIPFKPARSVIARGLLREGIRRVQQGRLSVRRISEISEIPAVSPIAPIAPISPVASKGAQQ